MIEIPCPCGSGQVYASCCGRFIDQGVLPETAEQLMRSRYTAFTQANEPYLLASWHASRRPGVVEFEPGCKWLGLEVRAARMTGADTAEVEFVARSRTAGRAQRLHERSRFVREGGRWYYVDGDML